MLLFVKILVQSPDQNEPDGDTLLRRNDKFSRSSRIDFSDVVGELYARFRPIKESDLFFCIM